MLLMLAQWLQSISPEFGFLRVFQYLTLRAVLAAVTALLITNVALGVLGRVAPQLNLIVIGFPVTILTWSGIASVNKDYYDIARTLGGNQRFLVLKVAIPAALPHVFVGLFMGLGTSFAVLVVAEMLGDLPPPKPIKVVVSEAGASVYSASELAAAVAGNGAPPRLEFVSTEARLAHLR